MDSTEKDVKGAEEQQGTLEAPVRDALGQFVTGHVGLEGGGRPVGSTKHTIDEKLDEYGPIHVDNLQAEAAYTGTARAALREKHEAKRDLTKLVGRRVADRIVEERGLTSQAERRLVEILSLVPLDSLREVINVGFIPTESGELGDAGDGEGESDG